jgi:hypothetical protein
VDFLEKATYVSDLDDTKVLLRSQSTYLNKWKVGWIKSLLKTRIAGTTSSQSTKMWAGTRRRANETITNSIWARLRLRGKRVVVNGSCTGARWTNKRIILVDGG